MKKKRIAKEWLIFLGLIAFGFLILPGLIYGAAKITSPYHLKGFKEHPHTMAEFYLDVYDAVQEFDYEVWIVLLSPYILVQLARSIVWAVKTVKSDGGKQ